MNEKMKDARFWQEAFLAAQGELDKTRMAAETTMAHLTRVEIENVDLKAMLAGVESRVRRLVEFMPADRVRAFVEQEGGNPADLGS